MFFFKFLFSLFILLKDDKIFLYFFVSKLIAHFGINPSILDNGLKKRENISFLIKEIVLQKRLTFLFSYQISFLKFFPNNHHVNIICKFLRITESATISTTISFRVLVTMATPARIVKLHLIPAPVRHVRTEVINKHKFS